MATGDKSGCPHRASVFSLTTLAGQLSIPQIPYFVRGSLVLAKRRLQHRLMRLLLCTGVAGALCASASGAAPAGDAPRMRIEGDVSNYVYGNSDGWSLPSQTAGRLAQKREAMEQRQEALARQRETKVAKEIAEAKPDLEREPLPELPAAKPVREDTWRLAQLGLAMLAGIGIAAAWNYFRQSGWKGTPGGSKIISVGMAQPAFAGIGPGPAAAPAPRVPPRGRGRRSRFGAPRKVRILDRRRDPHNESIRTLSGIGVLPKWVRDMTPLLSDGARLAGAVSDDVQMFSMGGDAVPNYAYMLDPKGMAASAERQREATAIVWSHQQWQPV